MVKAAASFPAPAQAQAQASAPFPAATSDAEVPLGEDGQLLTGLKLKMLINSSMMLMA